MVLRVGPLLPLRGAPCSCWIGLAASACKTVHAPAAAAAAAANSPVACTFAAAPHAAASWPNSRPQAAALLLLLQQSERLPSRGPPCMQGVPGAPRGLGFIDSQATGLSSNCCSLRSSWRSQGGEKRSLWMQRTMTATRRSHQSHTSNFSTSSSSNSNSSDSRINSRINSSISDSSNSSSSNSSNNNSSTNTSSNSSNSSKSSKSSIDESASASLQVREGSVGSSDVSLWQLLFAAVWPTSPGLKARVVAAVVSLMAAKVLTIAAPVALAAVVDHFTQSAAEGAAAAATAAATAATAAEALVTGPAALLHPALPVALVLSYPLARLGASAFTELRTALFARVSQRASRELAAAAFAHMHATAFSSNNKIGELSTILTRGTKAISSLLNVLLFQVFPTSLEFLLVLGLLQLRVGFAVSLTAVITLLFYWMFTAAVTTRRAKLRREMIRVEGQSAGLLVDSLANAEAVRYFTAEKFEARRFGVLQERLEEQMARVNESLAFLNFGQQLIFTSGLAAALLHTASLVAAGTVPVGQLVLVSTLLMQLAVPLNFIGTAYREVSLNTIDLEKLLHLLRLQPLVRDPPNPVVFQLRGGGISFKDVSFAYPPSQSLDQLAAAPLQQQKQQQQHQQQQQQQQQRQQQQRQQQQRLVLNGFNLEVPAGRRVALVGESGSGKTTLIRLLYRLIDPSSGCVLIDDQDLKTLSMESFRRHIGVVPQDVALFNESLGFNLRYGSPEATDAQVEEAVRLAELSDLVHALPGGLETPVGDRGVRLSGGEKQRVGIARCLLRNPEIVLFDEATSALDTHTEHKILRALAAVSRGRTTLVIAHRLSTVAGADTIAVLNGGRVAELGTHAQLLQSPNGLYASMWERQREGQGSEPSVRSP